jgi:hypothetical protein
MTRTLTSRAIERLTKGDPSYRELVDLYDNLRTARGETAREDVAQYALAQVVGEFVDYLDLVSREFEKSVGLTRTQERERLLAGLSPPADERPTERVASVVAQWRALDRYTVDDILESRDTVKASQSQSQLDA